MNKPKTSHIILLLIAGMFIGGLTVSQLEWTPETQANISSPAPSPAFAGTAPAKTPEPQSFRSNIIRDLNNAFIDIAEKVQPSVVTIFSDKVIRSTGSTGSRDDFFSRFFGFRMPDQQRERRSRGQGSGVVVSRDGYIMTNAHVIRDADEVQVMFVGGRRVDAEIVGTDPKTDIAVIKVNERGLTPMDFGNSDRLRVGEWVMAVGSPLDENLASTVTSGIISAKGRSQVGLADYEDFIQTDAAINPGNSGGALVNLDGELIGINTAIVSQSGGFQGIGFAVPVNMARHVMEALIRDGRVTRSYIGVTIQNIDQRIASQLELPSTRGALVSSVQEGSPADNAGVQVQDVITELDGAPVRDTAQLRNTISLMRPGSTISLQIYRDGRSRTLTAKLDELPPDGEQVSQSRRSSRGSIRLGFRIESLTGELARRYNIDPSERGVVISEIDRNSSAGREGLREGDIIKSINRKQIRNLDEFEDATADLKRGDSVLVYVSRQGNNFFRAFEIE